MIRETSLEAFREVQSSDVIGDMQRKVYCYLYVNGPLTANEIAYNLALKTKSQQKNIPTRLGELRDRGVVKEVGKKCCSITGMNVILWDVTANAPKSEVPKKMSRKELEQRYERSLAFFRHAAHYFNRSEVNATMKPSEAWESMRNSFD